METAVSVLRARDEFLISSTSRMHLILTVCIHRLLCYASSNLYEDIITQFRSMSPAASSNSSEISLLITTLTRPQPFTPRFEFFRIQRTPLPGSAYTYEVRIILYSRVVQLKIFHKTAPRDFTASQQTAPLPDTERSRNRFTLFVFELIV